MTNNTVVRARIDGQVKEEAAAVLATIAARRGDLVTVGAPDKLLASLHAGD